MRKKHLLLGMILVFLGFVLSGAIASTIMVVQTLNSLPSPEQFNERRINQTTKIYDRTGETLLYEIHGEEKRTVVPYEEIPEYAKQATLAAEDADFYTNPAFDWQAIVRAAIANLKQGRISQGGSTITQQLAKKIFLTDERTITRKIKELAIAIQLESRYTKDQILSFYLNQIPYGSNAYGIEAASQLYFATSSKNLTLAEAATLSGMIKAPSYYSPWGPNQKDLLKRKDFILTKMRELGYITENQMLQAQKQELNFAAQTLGNIKAPHFVLAVKDYLIEKYGEDMVINGGLRVITTLDWRLQEIAEKSVAEGAARNSELYGGSNAALVAQDPKTGQILALVGSKNYFDETIDGKYNVPLQGLRQPGSSFKPFVYMTAFKQGYQPKTLIYDAETEFDTTGIASRSYKPHNFDDLFMGPITLESSLATSRNVSAVKVLYLAGMNNVLNLAEKFGINTLKERSRYGLSLVLGGGEVRLVELVNAYSTLSQEGVRHNQSYILEVRDTKGKQLEIYRDDAERVIEPLYPRLVNTILSSKELRSPLYQSSLSLTLFDGYDVAVKTGTTNDYRDAWTLGYTPSLAVGVWAGNNANTPMHKQGSSILAALPIWNSFMKETLKYFSQESFENPEALPVLSKPLLNGSFNSISNPDGSTTPEFHDILHYVNKNNPLGVMPLDPNDDPQYQNWENGVKNWLLANGSSNNSWTRYLSPGTTSSSTTTAVNTGSAPVITNINPSNGAYIQSPFTLKATVTSGVGLKRIEIFINGRLIQMNDVSGTSYQISPVIYETLNPQNIVELRVFDQMNRETRVPIILYYKG